jgi:hypothetical protein
MTALISLEPLTQRCQGQWIGPGVTPNQQTTANANNPSAKSICLNAFASHQRFEGAHTSSLGSQTLRCLSSTKAAKAVLS